MTPRTPPRLLGEHDLRDLREYGEAERELLAPALSIAPNVLLALLDDIDTLAATLAEAQRPGGANLQHELLDLITLMPDSQTQELIEYILKLRESRALRGERGTE